MSYIGSDAQGLIANINGGTIENATLASSVNLDSGVNIKPLLNASGSAPIYACRAWVNFDGTNAFSPNPSTSAIRGSGNVSSITDNGGNGNYTVNFATAMPDANYCAVATGGDVPGTDYGGQVATLSHATGNFDIYCSRPYTIALNDLSIVHAAVFR